MQPIDMEPWCCWPSEFWSNVLDACGEVPKKVLTDIDMSETWHRIGAQHDPDFDNIIFVRPLLVMALHGIEVDHE